jgi:hypothetical protein
VGSDASNQQLSERRAEAVRAYLVDQKILASTVGTAGFGESRPVATRPEITLTPHPQIPPISSTSMAAACCCADTASSNCSRANRSTLT